MDTKRCRTCDEVKPLAEYWVARSNKGGLLHDCIPCWKSKHTDTGTAWMERSQKAIAAARHPALKKGQKRASFPDLLSTQEVAVKFGVSKKSLQDATRLLLHRPELGDAVERGEMTLCAAMIEAGLRRQRVSYRVLLAGVLLDRQDGICAGCGIELSAEAAEIDHIVPLDGGGQDDHTNLQALCKGCNVRKGASVLSERASHCI